MAKRFMTTIVTAGAPTVNDDANDGYQVGQLWLDTTTGTLRVLTDSTVAAAVWSSIGSGGGSASDATLTFTDITTNNVSITKHGFAPKAPNDSTQFLNGLGAWAVPPSSTGGAVSTQTGTTYTIVTGDNGNLIRVTNASAVTITLPNNLTAGFTVSIAQLGAGQITFVAASGATLTNRSSHTKTAGQYGVITLLIDANAGTAAHWILAGDTA